MTPDNPPSAPSVDAELAAIRALGWTVAVHNDYRLDSRQHTFWLFTKGECCQQAECPIEDEALALAALRKRLASRPSPTVERREKIAREIGQMIIAQLMLYDESGETSPSTDAEVEHLSEMIVREFLAQHATGAGIDDRPVTDKERARTRELAAELGWPATGAVEGED